MQTQKNRAAKTGRGKKQNEVQMSLLNDLNNSIPGDIGVTKTDDDVMDQETLHNELVKWAGRLELESIDLRDKSSGLIGELLKNSDILSMLCDSIKSDFGVIKRQSSDEIKKVTNLVTKAVQNIDNISTKVGKATNKVGPDVSKQLESLSTKLNSIPTDTAQANTNRKLQVLINTINRMKEDQNDVAFRKATEKNSMQLNNKVSKCLARIDQIYNLQIDLNKNINQLKISQESLSSEIQSLKNNQTNTRNSVPYPSPNSSLNEFQESTTLSQIHHNPNKVYHGRRQMSKVHKLNTLSQVSKEPQRRYQRSRNPPQRQLLSINEKPVTPSELDTDLQDPGCISLLSDDILLSDI